MASTPWSCPKIPSSMTRRLRLTLLLLLASLGLAAQRPRPLEIDAPACLHTERGQDSLRFPGSHARFDSLYRLVDTLLTERRGRLNILHIGGSHVQAGHFSARLRNRLSEGGLEPGNRGMLFPFAALKTNAPQDYWLRPEGTWLTARCTQREPSLPLGLSGASIESADSASLLLSLGSLLQWRTDTLRLLGEGPAPMLLSLADTIRPLTEGAPYRFALPQEADTLRLLFPAAFRLRGLLPEGRTAGFTYTTSGINGASLNSWLRCSRWEDELALVPPALVVLAIGVNDANVAPQQFDAEQFKANYRRLIGRIRRISPGCCFVFLTNNDCWFSIRGRRRQVNTNTPLVQRAMTELAAEVDGAVFDVFALMGGLRSSSAWVRAGLMRPDHIHFTRQGYELWADLLYNALIRDYDK